jgi:purine-binding chemotaxis protein CheW
MNETTTDASLVITFLLGESVFGIDASEVQEVVKVDQITPVHHAPTYVVGIRNLRGRIVTVIDLGARMELNALEITPQSRILIVDCSDESIGLLVDCVNDTINTDTNNVTPPPPSLRGVRSRYLRGVYRGGGRLVSLIDQASILGVDSPDATLATDGRDA